MKASSIPGRLVHAGVVVLVSIAAAASSFADEAPGLVARFKSLDHEGAHAVDVRSGIHLHVPAGESPTPFLPPGRFEAEFSGNLSVDIRSRYSFHMVSGGKATLSIDGEIVAESEDGEVTVERIRLNKGANPIRLTMASPEEGPTFVRLTLQARQNPLLPVMPEALTHESTAESLEASTLAHGRALFLANRCAKCHETGSASGHPELNRDAPSFVGIGSRLNADWMAGWVLDPRAHRQNATMPGVLHGPDAEEDARAVAAFLSTQVLQEPSEVPSRGEAAKGAELFGELHCGFCHQTPGAKADPALIPLSQVNEKFRPGALAAFLIEPEKHYAWIRMPNFGLSADEAANLASYLGDNATNHPAGAPADTSLVERGKSLVQSTGCLNCHQSPLQNEHDAPALSALTTADWDESCAGESPGADHPAFSFPAEESSALKQFVDSGCGDVGQFVRDEFATRESESLQCAKCHGTIEVIPPFELIGAKMKPEWSEKILSHAIGYDTRPLVKSRMPAFESRAKLLAQGLAQSFGYPPVTPKDETPVDTDLAEIGRKLVSTDGGFACVSCHGVGATPALAIFEPESAGINFVHTYERIQPGFYKSWVLNPVALDPRTKMPAFFYNGQSPLPTILDGSADRQIEAIWEYLRQGDRMAPPPQP